MSAPVPTYHAESLSPLTFCARIMVTAVAPAPGNVDSNFGFYAFSQSLK